MAQENTGAAAKPRLDERDVFDPLHQASAPNEVWSRVNMAEALPGVMTPLNASFWLMSMTVTPHDVFWRLGVMSRREADSPPEPGRPFTGVFFGRAAANVSRFRDIAARIPGTSSDSFEEQLLGSKSGDAAPAPEKPSIGRAIVALWKFFGLFLGLPREMHRLAEETHAWWRRSIDALDRASPDEALALYRDARARYPKIMVVQGLAVLFGQAIFEQLAKLVRTRCGEEALLKLASGNTALTEAGLVDRLWQIAKGRGDLQSFLQDYGFHAPDEGEISSVAWRENTKPIDAIIATYRGLPEERSPAANIAKTTADHLVVRREILSKGPFGWRLGVRMALAATARFMPLREIGKATYLQAVDVGRAAARAIGRDLAARGHLNAVDDVFYLTSEELDGAQADELKDIVRIRKARRERYMGIDLPDMFKGNPDNLRNPKQTAPAQRATSLQGNGVSAGVVRGRARIVRDPSAAGDFARGDILVCHTTDPGWTPLFTLASGLIVDIGGMLSHCALIARELGLPCVVNTREGTRVIPNGATVELDGATGRVRILDPQPLAAE